MKQRLVFLALLLFLSAGGLKSQIIPPPNPGLYINIVSGLSIDFVFDTFAEYHDGIEGAGQSTSIRIGAIYDWELGFRSGDGELVFTGALPGNQKELNNLGVVVISTGTNEDGGINITNFTQVGPLALASSDVLLLTKGNLTNKGYGIENSFILNWEMGTGNGNMNPINLLDQVLPADIYTVSVVLTLSVY